MVFKPEALISGLETRDILQSTCMQRKTKTLISSNVAADQRLCFYAHRLSQDQGCYLCCTIGKK